MEFVTFSQNSGFNIVEADDELKLQEQLDMPDEDIILIGNVEEVDKIIVNRIRELLN